jgi:hypothetical protein
LRTTFIVGESSAESESSSIRAVNGYKRLPHDEESNRTLSSQTQVSDVSYKELSEDSKESSSFDDGKTYAYDDWATMSSEKPKDVKNHNYFAENNFLFFVCFAKLFLESFYMIDLLNMGTHCY